jgi:hypothetical protein
MADLANQKTSSDNLAEGLVTARMAATVKASGVDAKEVTVFAVQGIALGVLFGKANKPNESFMYEPVSKQQCA